MTTHYKKEHSYAHELYYTFLKISSLRLFINYLNSSCFASFGFIDLRGSFFIPSILTTRFTKTLFINNLHFLKQLKIAFKDGSRIGFTSSKSVVDYRNELFEQLTKLSQLSELQRQNNLIGLILHPNFKKSPQSLTKNLKYK